MSKAPPSTFAASLCAQIDGRAAALERLDGALAAARTNAAAGAWSPREIILHLVGGLSDLPDHVADALGQDNPYVEYGQPGGEYIDDPSIETAQGAAVVLRQNLDVISAAVRDLDDAALQRTVTMAAGDGQASATLPIGLLVRYSLTTHFDEHLDQLREVLGAADSTDTEEQR